MKHLLLFRHAQAESAAAGEQDFKRSLTRHGSKEATEMARRLQRIGFIPDKIVTSVAVRAHTTATLIANALHVDATRFLTDDRIYNAGQSELLAVIRSAPRCERLMLVGHNPTISELADQLAQQDGISALPTCGMASLYFDIESWSELDWHTGRDVTTDSPDRSDH